MRLGVDRTSDIICTYAITYYLVDVTHVTRQYRFIKRRFVYQCVNVLIQVVLFDRSTIDYDVSAGLTSR